MGNARPRSARQCSRDRLIEFGQCIIRQGRQRTRPGPAPIATHIFGQSHLRGRHWFRHKEVRIRIPQPVYRSSLGFFGDVGIRSKFTGTSVATMAREASTKLSRLTHDDTHETIRA
jgi:hypothetical protein